MTLKPINTWAINSNKQSFHNSQHHCHCQKTSMCSICLGWDQKVLPCWFKLHQTKKLRQRILAQRCQLNKNEDPFSALFIYVNSARRVQITEDHLNFQIVNLKHLATTKTEDHHEAAHQRNNLANYSLQDFQ